MTYLYLAIFAILGAFARYQQTLIVQALTGPGFPWATLSINVLGSGVMGFLFFETLERITMSPKLRTGLLTGGLGAYTTFSTFSIETYHLLARGDIGRALLYITSSVGLSLIAVFLGAYLSRSIGV